MESLSWVGCGFYSSRLNKNGERLAHSRKEDDVGDEAPRHLQEGRWSEEGHPGGEEDLQEVFEVDGCAGSQDAPPPPPPQEPLHVLNKRRSHN